MIDYEMPIDTDARTAIEHLDSIAAVLSSGRRKRTLAALTSTDCALTLDKLAGDVADGAVVRGPADGRSIDRVKISLYHHHIPKLEDHGLVESESGRGPFRLTALGVECLEIVEQLAR